MNASTVYNNGPEATNECTINPNTTNIQQNNMAVVNTAENDTNIELPQQCGQQSRWALW